MQTPSRSLGPCWTRSSSCCSRYELEPCQPHHHQQYLFNGHCLQTETTMHKHRPCFTRAPSCNFFCWCHLSFTYAHKLSSECQCQSPDRGMSNRHMCGIPFVREVVSKAKIRGRECTMSAQHQHCLTTFLNAPTRKASLFAGRSAL